MAMSLLDDPKGTFAVLVNAEGQHSLWPSQLPVPEGWTQVTGPDTRDACLEYVEANWTDLRPNSVRLEEGN
ncbi:MbtH family protein [Streptomyces tibetensis]|uniref:MbtH family protein n=1 Tax=Streptomyces tibetensis TaxID=2382123 RepID=UPI0033CCEB90